MTGYELLAFVVLPIALAGFGWVIVLVNERYTRQHNHPHPGE
jgi:hypothetical protein